MISHKVPTFTIFFLFTLIILRQTYLTASTELPKLIRSTPFHIIQSGRFGNSWTPPSLATTHSPALKQSLLHRLSFKITHSIHLLLQDKVPEGWMRCASPASLHFVPFVTLLSILILSIPFATPQQHTRMVARLLPPHLFSARQMFSFAYTWLKRPVSSKTHHNVTRPTIQAS